MHTEAHFWPCSPSDKNHQGNSYLLHFLAKTNSVIQPPCYPTGCCPGLKGNRSGCRDPNVLSSSQPDFQLYSDNNSLHEETDLNQGQFRDQEKHNPFFFRSIAHHMPFWIIHPCSVFPLVLLPSGPRRSGHLCS